MKPHLRISIKVTLLLLSILSSGSAGCARITEASTVEPTQVENKVDLLDAAITKAAQGYNQPTQVEQPQQVAIRQAPVEEFPLIQTPQQPSYGVVKAIERANVRSGTGLNYPILYVLEVGETAKLADRNPRFVNGITWYAVRGEFGNGWVASSLVRL